MMAAIQFAWKMDPVSAIARYGYGMVLIYIQLSKKYFTNVLSIYFLLLEKTPDSECGTRKRNNFSINLVNEMKRIYHALCTE